MTQLSELKQIAKQFKGKSGGPEAESILVDSNMDKKDGFVSVWSNRHDLTKIIERCGPAIVSYKVMGDMNKGGGVQLLIKRSAYRGIQCAFRNSK